MLSSLLARSCTIRFAQVANFEKFTDVPPVAIPLLGQVDRDSLSQTLRPKALAIHSWEVPLFLSKATFPNDE